VRPREAREEPFGDRVARAVEEKRSQLVVGLDPRLDLLPVELRGDAHLGPATAALAHERFCRAVVDAVAPYAIGVKPQLAFFEEHGSQGLHALEQVVEYARNAGLLVLLDGKRGDIGSTARAYASAYLEPRGPLPPLGDALTVNPYLGTDAVEPFVSACRREGTGVFCLVKTSNPGSTDLQDLALSDGRPLWQHVGELVDHWGETVVGEQGLSSVGAVIGATHPHAIAEARRVLPRAILLMPGVGAQGAEPADLRPAFMSGPASVLVPVARSVIYAFRDDEDSDWRSTIAQAAARLRTAIWKASGW
jgi:orotidine-5'-phosphate decarboxylase